MNSVINCIVTSDYSTKKNGNKKFFKGDKISGKLVKGTENIKNPLFKTNDGFILPKSILNPIQNEHSNADSETYAEVVEDKPIVIDLPNGFKNNMSNIFKDKSNTAVNGALIGLVIGLGFSMYKQKSKLIFSSIGAIVGFVTGNAYNSYMSNNNEEEK